MKFQTTLPTAPDLCKNVSVGLSYYVVATVIHIQFLRSQICVYIDIHIRHNIETVVGQRKGKITGTAVNAACPGNLST